MDTLDVAWAGGLFEAEGSVSHSLPKGRKTFRATLDVSQRGEGRPPAVLVRFREIVGAGSLFGPYRGYLYYWRSHDAGLIGSVVTLLWPWLSPERREQIRATLVTVPALWATEACGELLAIRLDRDDPECARAWAAGFFEGDGTIGAYSARRHAAGRPVLGASIGQASSNGVPTCLTRFQSVIGAGTIRGPIAPRGWSKLPQYRWLASGEALASAMQALIPYFVGPKHGQVLDALARSQWPRLTAALAETPSRPAS
jgi:hypothetical protein